MSRLHLFGSRKRILRLLAVVWVLAVVCPAVWAKSGGEAPPAVAKKPVAAQAETKRDAVFGKPVPESIADLRAIENRVKRLAKSLTRCTVALSVGNAQGSGVIVSKDGHVLTAAHVVGAPGRSVTLLLADGRAVKGTSLGLDRTIDAALVKITEDGDWPFAEMGDVKNVKFGDWCIATGHPGGYRAGRAPVVRLGRVVLTRGTLVQSDCTLVGGDSGGPLFDMEGRVIGIHSRIGAPTAWNFHIPISAYTKNWDRLTVAEVRGGRPAPGGAFLGISGEDVENGCRLTEIAPGLPAEKAGLRAGDVIVKFDDRPITCFNDLAAVIGGKKPGDEVALEILRAGKTIRKTVVLTKRGE